MTRLLTMRHLLLSALAVLAVLTLVHSQAQDAKPKTDRERLRGTWHVIQIEENGAALAKIGSHKLIITDKKMTLSGFPDTYELDEKSDPKQLNFGFLPGIYKLDGDKLTYCMSTASSAPRPTKFATAPGESAQLFELRRSPILPADAPEKDFDKRLKSTIKEGAKLLEAKRDADCLKLLMPPAEFKLVDEKRLKEILDNFESRRLPMLNTLRVLPKLKPEIRTTKIGTVAVFDLSRIHIVDGAEAKAIAFLKEGDNWYLINDQQVGE